MGSKKQISFFLSPVTKNKDLCKKRGKAPCRKVIKSSYFLAKRVFKLFYCNQIRLGMEVESSLGSLLNFPLVFRVFRRKKCTATSALMSIRSFIIQDPFTRGGGSKGINRESGGEGVCKSVIQYHAQKCAQVVCCYTKFSGLANNLLKQQKSCLLSSDLPCIFMFRF